MGKHSKTRHVSLADLGPRAQAQILAMGPPPPNKRMPGAGLVPVGAPTEPVNKYGVADPSARTYRDQVFDSKLEANCARRLDQLGIKYRTQIPFVLQEGFVREGRKIRSIEYVADFVIDLPDGRVVVLDSKALELPLFKLKRKMLWYKYPDLLFHTVSSPATLTELVVKLGLAARPI